MLRSASAVGRLRRRVHGSGLTAGAARLSGRPQPSCLLREVPARPPRRHDGDRAARMRSAVATDRAAHNPFQAVPPGGSHHERIAGQGDRGQYRAWVAFRRLDHHVEIIRNVPCGRTERTPGQFPGQLAWHGSGIGDGQAAAAATVMPPATVPGQPEAPRPDGNQPGPPRPRKRHRATQCRHTAGRVIDTHDDPSALTAGIRRQAYICHDCCHHLSPSTVRFISLCPASRWATRGNPACLCGTFGLNETGQHCGHAQRLRPAAIPPHFWAGLQLIGCTGRCRQDH
jgi:hypothetical protein